MRDVTRSSDTFNRTTVEDREVFAETLMDLKRRGCCVLVTGKVNERARAAQSRRLFGQSNTSRHRVLTLIDATPSAVSRYLPEGITPTHSTVTKLDFIDDIRLVADFVDNAAQSETESTEVNDAISMATIGSLLHDPIREALRSESFRPGELRLGIATLRVLIDTDGLTATKAFVQTVRNELVDINGMGHFHLPGELEAKTFTAFRPLIDIHIELRQTNCVLEHRWHLLETGESTSWFRL